MHTNKNGIAVRRGLAALGGAVTGAVLLAAPVSAHVSPDKSEVPAGGFTDVALTVGHGCEASPTRQVSIQVPDLINNVTPGVLPGWDIEVVNEALAEPIEGSHGEEITERETEVIYTAQAGSELADGFRQSFTLGFQAPDAPGEHLFFKTIQTCVEGETAWIEEYTGEGEEPDHPSPVVLVTESTSEGHGASEEATDEEEDAELADAEEAAATSDDEDDDSSTGLALAALVVGALGLLAGGTALVRSRR
jgi:periplasmic copper chaperone A